jgi:mono/diheme cytochrome c family protein
LIRIKAGPNGLSQAQAKPRFVPLEGHIVKVQTIPMFASMMIAGATAVPAQDLGDKSKGLVFAEGNCAACHAVMPSGTPSPRTDAATFAAIANTPGMTELALAVWLKTPHRNMPNLIIAKDDMENVIAYIVSLRIK